MTRRAPGCVRGAVADAGVPRVLWRLCSCSRWTQGGWGRAGFPDASWPVLGPQGDRPECQGQHHLAALCRRWVASGCSVPSLPGVLEVWAGVGLSECWVPPQV